MEYKHLISAIDEWLAAQRDNYINDLIESISIRSVATPGEGGYTFGTGCAQCVDEMLDAIRTHIVAAIKMDELLDGQ